MPVRGVTKNVAIAPRGTKDLNPEENFIPGQIDLKNGFITERFNSKPSEEVLFTDLPINGRLRRFDIDIGGPV